MGLDMYLKSKKYIGGKKIIIPEIADEDRWLHLKSEYDNVKEITFERGYWRKANQIHSWFVENVQNGEDNCNEYYETNT